ncbi:Sphingosine-1-phosphate lyase 1 isoform X1 [Oopsacas minuta]|uniref:sphinganine-1-phosphate aldolase n=1 Tax=Oopsacas minuta TaxID=111878 RepID=A0AAV7KFK9_9METZ|nr:Sphingosine-1-phosphate lyase 1 isoform X1 [Oopsacas minuta]
MHKLLLILSLLALSVGIFPERWMNILHTCTSYLVKNQFVSDERVTNIQSHLFLPDYFSSPLPVWRVALISSILTFLIYRVHIFVVDHRLPCHQRALQYIFDTVRRFPIIKTMIAKEISKVTVMLNDSFKPMENSPPSKRVLPIKGLTREELNKECKLHANMGEWRWKEGRVSGAVYVHDEEHRVMMEDVYGLFYESNPLHPDVFPGVRKMEAEIVSMCLHLFHGQNGGCGATTSGGTESILMAMKAYREIGYSRGIKYPEIVLTHSSHSAFIKACSYFGMRPVRLSVDKDYKSDVSSYRKAITENTVVLIASAPGFPHGVIDPVEEIAKLGLKYNVGVHVDCCLGGLLVPFVEETGRSIPVVDFRVDGVTSISCDTHKYGYGPKGCSVIMYRSQQLRNMQYFVDTDWAGGIYASPCIAGSRSGLTLAGTWATLVHIGREGYVEKTKAIIEIRENIEKCVRNIPDLFVFGTPQLSVLAIGSKTIDIYCVSDCLSKKGWHLNNLQFPAGFHICFTSIHIGRDIPKQFVSDLIQSIEEVKTSHIKPSGIAGIYGMAVNIPDRKLVREISHLYIDTFFKT